MNAAELIIGDYLKTYDGNFIRISSMDVIQVAPLQDNWIIASVVNGAYYHIAYFKTQEEAVKRLTDLLYLIRIGE